MRAFLVVGLMVLVLAAPAVGQDGDKGSAAYKHGDYATALREWRPLAESGNPYIQYNFGLMYRDGQGVPQDYTEAVKWFRLAAEQGFYAAQYDLGVMYDNGQGVPQDYAQAHMWLNLAAAQGHAEAVKGRDIVSSRMTPAQVAEAQRLARKWLEKHK